jgi:hypothetical protein
MAEIVFVGLDGGSVSVGEAAIEALKTELRGTAVRPGEPGYDEARTLYNAMIDNKPALTVRCAGVADVIAGVRFARARPLGVGARWRAMRSARAG